MSTAGQVMDSSAALLNDVAKSLYTYTAQLPYLKMTLKELREVFELNNIPVTRKVSALINVPTGITEIGFTTTPALPSDLVEIEGIWERQEGVEPYVPMRRVYDIPQYMTSQTISTFGIWAWKGRSIFLLAANRDNDIKIDYIAELFNEIVDENSNINATNVDSFLHFRNASLCAQYIGENPTRATELKNDAYLALERSTGISTKAMQIIATRHRPFRASYKARSGAW